MIVPAMTEHEIREEMLYDIKNIPSSKMDSYRKDFRSLVFRSSKFPVSKSYECKTKKRNLLVITLSALKRGQHKNPIMSVYCVYERPEGKYAAVFSVDNRISIFIPHFLDRYQERILKNDFMPRNEVIKRFVANSWGHASLEINDEVEAVYKCFEGHYSDEIISVVSATSEGYCFGEKHENVVVMKTIISEDMLSDRQKRLFPRMREQFFQANKSMHGEIWTPSNNSYNGE